MKNEHTQNSILSLTKEHVGIFLKLAQIELKDRPSLINLCCSLFYTITTWGFDICGIEEWNYFEEVCKEFNIEIDIPID